MEFSLNKPTQRERSDSIPKEVSIASGALMMTGKAHKQ
jgi:hypothetical protein